MVLCDRINIIIRHASLYSLIKCFYSLLIQDNFRLYFSEAEALAKDSNSCYDMSMRPLHAI